MNKIQINFLYYGQFEIQIFLRPCQQDLDYAKLYPPYGEVRHPNDIDASVLELWRV